MPITLIVKICATILCAFLPLAASRAAVPSVDFKIQLDTVTSGYDGKYCWVQARAGAIPRVGQPPIVVITMNRLLVTGSDVYFPINEMRSDNFGRTWSGPVEHPQTMGRRQEANGVQVVISDFWPKWHAKTGRLLGTGHTVRYRDDRGPDKTVPRNVTFSVYDPVAKTWANWETLDVARDADLAFQSGAGCVQRYDLPNGEILLPVSFRAPGVEFSRVKVLRCSFDGRTLKMLERGNTLKIDSKRGIGEPSITRYKDRYFLTIRHDDASWVATSKDGLNFGELTQWRWDDGSDLGSYNTQTHWVTHEKALFLTYTRRGANNDHVFRHRAPLFIAEVNPETLRVIRATERILLPEKGARYGNFGVCEVSENETWVVDTEWMQRPGPDFIIPVDNPYGAKGRVYAARIQWAAPNRAGAP